MGLKPGMLVQSRRAAYRGESSCGRKGIDEIKTALDSLLATPGFDLAVEYTLIGSDSAVVGWTANGTRADTSRLAQVSGVTVLQISEGKIVRETWYYDPAKAPF